MKNTEGRSLSPEGILEYQIYGEQRKGYTLINFTCGCGNRGRRRYYKNSFKPLCRRCLREHNKKEKIKRSAEFQAALSRVAEIFGSGLVKRGNDWMGVK